MLCCRLCRWVDIQDMQVKCVAVFSGRCLSKVFVDSGRENFLNVD